jgi:hypothetical protein
MLYCGQLLTEATPYLYVWNSFAKGINLIVVGPRAVEATLVQLNAWFWIVACNIASQARNFHEGIFN